MEYACLFFDADDAVCIADIFDVPSKAGAYERACELLSSPGITGFQIWREGAKVAEYFHARDARESTPLDLGISRLRRAR